MARIAGINIPKNKQIWIALTYIYGIGKYTSLNICKKVKIPYNKRVHDLSDNEVLQLREIIDQEYIIEGDLRREVHMNIKKMMDLGVYRGLRHRRNMTVRGQRTHNNNQTRRSRSSK